MRPIDRPFIAFIRKQPDAGFGVSFPDLPQCNSSGPTIDAARQNAEFSLALHCHYLRDAGKALPTPSYMQELAARRENVNDGLVVLIPPPRAA